jgi:hypothetical protein
LAGAEIDREIRSGDRQRRLELKQFAEVPARQHDRVAACRLSDRLPEIRLTGHGLISQIRDGDRAHLNRLNQ